MTEYHAPPGHDVYGKEYHGQRLVEENCAYCRMQVFANSYDLALPMDADEFLWLAPINTTVPTTTTITTSNSPPPPPPPPRYPTLQEFLEPYQAQNYTYLSIGKFSYTTLHVDNRYFNSNDNTTNRNKSNRNKSNKNKNNNNYFSFLQYPYSTGPYCLKWQWQNPFVHDDDEDGPKSWSIQKNSYTL